MYIHYFSTCILCPLKDEKLKYRQKILSEAESLRIGPWVTSHALERETRTQNLL